MSASFCSKYVQVLASRFEMRSVTRPAIESTVLAASKTFSKISSTNVSQKTPHTFGIRIRRHSTSKTTRHRRGNVFAQIANTATAGRKVENAATLAKLYPAPSAPGTHRGRRVPVIEWVGRNSLFKLLVT